MTPKQRVLELAVLSAARALRGSMIRGGGTYLFTMAAAQRFINAEDALHKYHARRLEHKRG